MEIHKKNTMIMKIFSVLVYHLAVMPISNQIFHMSNQINKDIRYFFPWLAKVFNYVRLQFLHLWRSFGTLKRKQENPIRST